MASPSPTAGASPVAASSSVFDAAAGSHSSLTLNTRVLPSAALNTSPTAPMSPQLAQLRSVLAQLTAVTDDLALQGLSLGGSAGGGADPSSAHVAELEARVREYETMIGAASLAQRKQVAQIATLERQLAAAEAYSKKKQEHSKPDHAAAGASTAATPASAYLASHFAYPAQFEANLSQFLSEHVDVSAEPEVWGWTDFPPHDNHTPSAAAAAAVSSTSALPPRTLPPVTVTKLMKLQMTQPTQLFACPRLGVGLDFGFSQLHSLLYLQAVTASSTHMP